MTNKPPAYPNYASDWLSGTAHLTLEQQGAYKRILDHEWIDGPLPNDLEHIAQLIGMSAKGTRFKKLWARIERHFPTNGDGTRKNKRLEEEREKQQKYRQRQANAGRISAERRGNGG